jgi:hypothetical protein
MALDGTGLGVEREVARAATRAGLAMITPGQGKWAKEQGVVALAPVLRHIEGGADARDRAAPLPPEDQPDAGLRRPGGGVAGSHRPPGRDRSGRRG